MNSEKFAKFASVKRLNTLKFDPMQQLIAEYERIEDLITYHDGLKDGTIIQLNSNGRYVNYNPRAHIECYDRLTAISKELLRYGYARVPENIELEDHQKELPSLNVFLHKYEKEFMSARDHEELDESNELNALGD